MKILHCADWQIGASPGLEGNLSRQRQALLELVEIAQRERPEAVLVVGDVFEHGLPTAQVKDLVISAVDALDRLEIPVLILPGNHDYEDRAMQGYTPLMTLKLLESRFFNVKVATEPAFIDYGTFAAYALPPSFDGKEALTGDNVESIKQTVASGKPVVLLLHAMVQGSVFSNGQQAEDGFHPDLLAHCGATYIALGDIHKRQRVDLGDGAPEAWYCGSLLQHDFGENPKECGVLMVEASTTGVEVRPVHLEKTPELRQYSVTAKELSDLRFLPNAIAKLTIVGTPDELRTVDSDYLKELAENQDVALTVQRQATKAEVVLEAGEHQEVHEILQGKPEIELHEFIQSGNWPVDEGELEALCLAYLLEAQQNQEAST